MNNELKNRLDNIIEINEMSMSMIDKICEMVDTNTVTENEYEHIELLLEHLADINKAINNYGSAVADIVITDNNSW